MNLLVTKLVELSIVDVRAKPPGVTATLSRAGGARLSAEDVSELSSRGFYFTSDGRLLSNQGEVLVHTDTGVFYALRFGELAPGATKENRYLFISVGFDSGAAGGAISPEVRERLDAAPGALRAVVLRHLGRQLSQDSARTAGARQIRAACRDAALTRQNGAAERRPGPFGPGSRLWLAGPKRTRPT